MKNLSLFGLLFLTFFFFFSCTSINRIPYIYTNNINTEFEILGEIFIESNERVGYIELLNAARNLYPECHFVIDIMMDQIITNKVRPFRRTPEITGIIWRMRGTAVKYKNIDNFSSLKLNEPFHIIANNVPVRSNNPASPSPSASARPNNVIEKSVVAPTPVVATRANIDTRTSINEIGYTVETIVGNVQYQRNMGDSWNDVIVGDIFTVNIRIRTALNSSLILMDNSRRITIQGGREGRIDSLVR